jgi:hypothetical protein
MGGGQDARPTDFSLLLEVPTVKPRTSKTLSFLAVILGFAFIAWGDRILPEPMKTVSFRTRTTIERFLLGMTPDWNPENPNERTEKAIEEELNRN